MMAGECPLSRLEIGSEPVGETIDLNGRQGPAVMEADDPAFRVEYTMNGSTIPWDSIC
jgi:hypothetical protein